MELPDFDVSFGIDNSVMIGIEGEFSMEERMEIQQVIQQELDLDFKAQKKRKR